MRNIGRTFSNETFIWGGTNTLSRLSHIFVSLSQSYMIEKKKIPSEMEVAPPHKRFTQFSALIKL